VVINARLDSAGSLSVTERVTFKADPGTHMLTISVRPSTAAGLTDAFTPRLQSIQASAPGERLTLIDVDDTKVAFFAGNTRSLLLRYRLDGVLQDSGLSPSGRSLVFVTGLDVAPTSDLARTITVSGATNMGCAAPGQMMEFCGSGTQGAWTVTLPPEQADRAVYAQIDVDGTSG
jgi:hypothetical protein